jgi:hypothetical protein
MFARLTVYDDVDAELNDRAREWLQALGADPFRELPGYQGSMTLLDRDNAQLIGIGFYASAADVREAERRLPAIFEAAAPRVPDALRPMLDMRPASVALFEVVHRD